MTDIKPGDLVLRDGRAEEVQALSSLGMHYTPKYAPPVREWPLLVEATRIGSTHDGWRIHTGSERPAGVGAEDRVQAWLSGDVRLWSDEGRLAKSWCWSETAPGAAIVAYRVVQRAERAEPAASELRAVAEEMRELSQVVDPEGWPEANDVLKEWADRIDPPKPEPLKVGDRVRLKDEDPSPAQGKVMATHEDQAWVQFNGQAFLTVSFHNLERIA